MKKILLILVCIFSIFTLISCGEENNAPTVEKYEVIEYQEQVYTGDEFDEESVFIKVTFSNGKTMVYCGYDLSFNYDEFDSSKEGIYVITVTIDALNISTDIEVEVVKKVFKVLMIANSYGDDTVQWVHEIASNLGIEFKIANLYIGGCILQTHLSNLRSDAKAYQYVVYNSNSRTWSRISNTSIKEALNDEDWNYVSLQQGSSQSGLADTYDLIDDVMDEVLEIKEDVKFIWNMTWAYQQDSGHGNFGTYGNNQMTMYNAILNCVQTKVVPNDRFETIVPNGTAVQNARTSYIGDHLCRDQYCHLTNDLGRYIAGLTMVGALTGADLTKVTYSPNLSDYNRKLAIESAMNALSNPFSITQSKYTEEEQMDLTNYTELDWEPVGCAFWNSTDTNKYNVIIKNASNSKNFIASKRFTRSELPVGTVIVISSGYQYRPEAWVTDSVQSTATRPGNVTTKYVVVTEEWWGNYIYRAFNISAVSGNSFENGITDGVNAFKIYVPNK